MLWSLLTVVASVWLILSLVAFLFQERMVYFPTATLEATPAQAGLDYQDVYLETEDGVRLHGWYLPAPRARGSLLFFHGNAGNISHRLASLGIFQRLGLNTLIIDYRGYGRSEGRPGEKGTYRDAAAAWRHLVEDRGERPERIVVFGRSLGAGVAAWLAAEHPPGALILESSFTSMRDLARVHYPYLPARLLLRIHYPVLERLARIDAPVLVVHSPDDHIIPVAMGRRLYEAARGPKAFLELSGDHNSGFLLAGPRYIEGLDAFLGAHLGPWDGAPQ